MLTPFPSATALALALGARLTLRGITLRRNPWTFGVSREQIDCPAAEAARSVSVLDRRSLSTAPGIRFTPTPIAAVWS